MNSEKFTKQADNFENDQSYEKRLTVYRAGAAALAISDAFTNKNKVLARLNDVKKENLRDPLVKDDRTELKRTADELAAKTQYEQTA